VTFSNVNLSAGSNNQIDWDVTGSGTALFDNLHVTALPETSCRGPLLIETRGATVQNSDFTQLSCDRDSSDVRGAIDVGAPELVGPTPVDFAAPAGNNIFTGNLLDVSVRATQMTAPSDIDLDMTGSTFSDEANPCTRMRLVPASAAFAVHVRFGPNTTDVCTAP
jgi:hypothetical protein